MFGPLLVISTSLNLLLGVVVVVVDFCITALPERTEKFLSSITLSSWATVRPTRLTVGRNAVRTLSHKKKASVAPESGGTDESSADREQNQEGGQGAEVDFSHSKLNFAGESALSGADKSDDYRPASTGRLASLGEISMANEVIEVPPAEQSRGSAIAGPTVEHADVAREAAREKGDTVSLVRQVDFSEGDDRTFSRWGKLS